MAKTCIEPGCDRPQFGGQRCKYHQYKRHMRGGDLYKPKKTNKPPPKESKKRKQEHKRYSEQKDMFIQENRDNGTFYCFITKEQFDNTIDGFCTVHHLRGRSGDYYLDKDHWILARNKNHLDVFHGGMTYAELCKQDWWDDFLNRIRVKDIESYNKLMRTKEKAEVRKLNPTLDFDEEIF